MPREHGFCQHTVASRGLLEIPGARLDARFIASPLVAAEGGVRFYAGAPLTIASGHCLGALCVLDSRPRAPLSAAERQALVGIAKLATDLIEA